MNGVENQLIVNECECEGCNHMRQNKHWIAKKDYTLLLTRNIHKRRLLQGMDGLLTKNVTPMLYGIGGRGQRRDRLLKIR